MREELSATTAQLVSARSELAAALPMVKSTENELSTADSDLALIRSNLVDAVAEISSLKTSLEQTPHPFLKTRVETLEVAHTKWHGYLLIMLYPHR